jgi:hypothetical protein
VATWIQFSDITGSVRFRVDELLDLRIVQSGCDANDCRRLARRVVNAYKDVTISVSPSIGERKNILQQLRFLLVGCSYKRDLSLVVKMVAFAFTQQLIKKRFVH